MRQPKAMVKSRISLIIISAILLIMFSASYGIAQKRLTAEDYLRQGEAHYKDEKYAEAITDFTKAIQINPQNAEAYNKRGLAYRGPKFDKFHYDYSKVPNILKDSTAWGDYVAREIKQGRDVLDLSIADFNKAIELNPQFSEAYYNRGNIDVGLLKNAAAIADYTKAIELNPQYAEAYNKRGLAYLQQIEIEFVDGISKLNVKARDEKSLDKARDEKVFDAFFSAYLAKFDTGLTDINKAIGLNPKFSEAYFNRATFYLALAMFDEANGEDKADQKKADAARKEYERKFELAIADLTTAIELNPQYTEAYLARGSFYAKQKKIDLTLADYTKAIQLSPKYFQTYVGRALLYCQQGKKDLAEADERKAVELGGIVIFKCQDLKP